MVCLNLFRVVAPRSNQLKNPGENYLTLRTRLTWNSPPFTLNGLHGARQSYETSLANLLSSKKRPSSFSQTPFCPSLSAAASSTEKTDVRGWVLSRLLAASPSNLPESAAGALVLLLLQKTCCPCSSVKPTLPRGHRLPRTIQGLSWLPKNNLATVILPSLFSTVHFFIYTIFFPSVRCFPCLFHANETKRRMSKLQTQNIFLGPHFSSSNSLASLISFYEKCLNLITFCFLFSLLLTPLAHQ